MQDMSHTMPAFCAEASQIALQGFIKKTIVLLFSDAWKWWVCFQQAAQGVLGLSLALTVTCSPPPSLPAMGGHMLDAFRQNT